VRGLALGSTQAVLTHDTLSLDLDLDLDLRGGSLQLLTRPGVVVDTDDLVTDYAKIKARRSAPPETPWLLSPCGPADVAHGPARPPGGPLG
jgi:hypothetical protein